MTYMYLQLTQNNDNEPKDAVFSRFLGDWFNSPYLLKYTNEYIGFNHSDERECHYLEVKDYPIERLLKVRKLARKMISFRSKIFEMENWPNRDPYEPYYSGPDTFGCAIGNTVHTTDILEAIKELRQCGKYDEKIIQEFEVLIKELDVEFEYFYNLEPF